ncbi:Uu.00g025060.m01.CDS01 [Anthostomella pinea]|uniref:Uu.00g025060.m01.CDS01 n=1 Tax=Anthostomella pinea TaxID=933095 RepID=A0AAI8YCL4_9PEZI|nr:Uu.00g025060.m01.CDS01 [Anthostomella pinea]
MATNINGVADDRVVDDRIADLLTTLSLTTKSLTTVSRVADDRVAKENDTDSSYSSDFLPDEMVATPVEDPRDGIIDHEALLSCVVCDGDANLRCPRCGARYCAQACYKVDWPTHKHLCESATTEYSEEKAETDHIRAIIFRCDKPHAEFIWLDKDQPEVTIAEVLGYGTNLDSMNREVQPRNMINYGPRKRLRGVGRGIRWYPSPFRTGRQGGNHINKSLMALSKPAHMMVYHGDQLFVPFSTKEYHHASLRDYRFICDFLRTRWANPCFDNALTSHMPLLPTAQIWSAVKLNCEGDMARLSPFCGEGNSLPMIEDVSIFNIDLGNEHKRGACILPKMAGLSWVAQPCTTNQTVEPTAGLDNYGGRIFCTTDTPDADCLMESGCGSVIVSRPDGRPIKATHVLCFYDFAEVQLRKAGGVTGFQHDTDTERHYTSDAELRKLVTKEIFKEYWGQWMCDRMKDGHKVGIDELMSPYQPEEATTEEAEKLKDDDKSAAKLMMTPGRLLQPVTPEEHEKILEDAMKVLGF